MRFIFTLLICIYWCLIAQGQTPIYTDSCFSEESVYIGVSKKEFNRSAFVRKKGFQKQSNWCWAACTQMILNYNGTDVEQEELVMMLYDSLLNQKASFLDLYNIFGGNQFLSFSQNPMIVSIFEDTTISPLKLKEELSNKWIPLIGLNYLNDTMSRGHMYLAIGVTYQIDCGRYIPKKLLLFDPMPRRKQYIEISWEDFLLRNPEIAYIYVKDILSN